MRKKLEELTLADDFIFCKVMSKPENAKEFLEELFQRKITRIQSVSSQVTAQDSYDSHGTRFDVEFLGDGSVYDIEMQTTGTSKPEDVLELLRRSRYYHANIATRYLSTGQSYKKLPKSYVIFICTFDLFGKGLAKYTQCACIEELRAFVDDGVTTVYLNTEFTRDNSSGLVHDLLLYLRDPGRVHFLESEYITRIHTDVCSLKTDSTVRREFMSLSEKLQHEREEGRQEGRQEGVLESLRRLIESGMPEEEARRILQIPGDVGTGVSRLNLQ